MEGPTFGLERIDKMTWGQGGLESWATSPEVRELPRRGMDAPRTGRDRTRKSAVASGTRDLDQGPELLAEPHTAALDPC